jgi:predicted metal-dependent enzyme (double-stranded beta helix superfamily)
MTAPNALSGISTATPRLARYIDEVRGIVAAGMPPDLTVRLVGERLAAHLGAADLLTACQREGHPDRYRQHLLHAERGFSIVALVWLPGQRTEIHDHLAWCVTGVHEGEEQEQRFSVVSDDSTALAATEKVVNRRGDVCGFAPPGDIHRVWNGGTGKAVSLHVYGADISARGSSIRRVYDRHADES